MLAFQTTQQLPANSSGKGSEVEDSVGTSGANSLISSTQGSQERTQHQGKDRNAGPKSLDKWREAEDDEEDGFAISQGKRIDGASSVEPGGSSSAALKRERAKRAVTSESWDDDFLFQHESSSSKAPERSHSRPPSRSSRPTTPLPPKTSTLAPPSLPPSSQSRPRNISPYTHSFQGSHLSNLANPSLDSLVSSIDWSAHSDLEEPTLTLSSEQSTPKTSRTSPSPLDYRKTHRSNPSTSTARPTTASSQHTVTSPSELPRRPPAPPFSYSSSSRNPSNATTNRSDTPSLTADSLRSLTSTFTTGDELKTETEDDETEDERGKVASSPRPGLFNLKRYSRELLPSPPTSPILKPSQSKRWRFGRSKKEPSDNDTKETGQRSSGIFGRRTGPRELEEVVTIDTTEVENREVHLRRSVLPLPVRDGQFVVLGRRSRESTSQSTQSAFRLAAVPHPKGSSSTSTKTHGSGKTRPRPDSTSKYTSTQPQCTDPPPLPSPHSTSSTNGWSRYDDAAPRSPGDETAEADVSEFSGDERFHLPTRLSNKRRRSIATNAPSTSQSPPLSPTFPRPSSPVESILGEKIGKWNSSQVSFASTASATGHAKSQSSNNGYETTRPEDSMKNRKRKLVKRRPGSEVLEPGSQPSLDIEDGSSRQPLLSAVSSRSSASSNPLSTSSQLLPPTNHDRSPSLPFAQESDRESPQRPSFTRRRSSTTPSKSSPSQRGEVVELDPDWLGVVPFPPSPPKSFSVDHSVAPVPSSPISTLRRPAAFRSVSGRSHPPITIRTQAETKAKRNSGGIGQSISNIISRSSSTLPPGAVGGGGKRAPSPAPSAKSVMSSKSLLMRSTSKKGKSRELQESSPPEVPPKSPSLLKKRSSAVVSPPRTKLPVSSPSTPTSTVKLSKHTRTSTDATIPSKSPSISSPSFFSRTRNLSRSANSKVDPLPSPPSSPSIPRSSSARQMPPPPLPSHSTPLPRNRPPNSTAKGQLNTSFKMPRSQTVPPQAIDSSTKPSRDLAKIPKQEPSPTRTRSAEAGHRPSLSLSSIMRSSSSSVRPRPSPPLPAPIVFSSPARPQTPLERPRTALGTDHPPAHHDFEDEASESDYELVLPRRNSLSDLRIPARITNAQKKIEEDLERVKQFAKGIEDLKELRQQYDHLISILGEKPATTSLSTDAIDTPSVGGKVQGLRRIELDYSQYWEQARTLIDLGDGKQTQRTSPGTLASRRDRCVSMAAESMTSSNVDVVSGSETETEETRLSSRNTSTSRPPSVLFNLSSGGGTGKRRSLARMPSASSIETEASVGARQREMLRGVLAPANKGASLPSRGPPSPRPTLAVLAPLPISTEAEQESRSPPSTGASPTKRPPFSLQLPSSSTIASNNSRRVSRVGVSGIREFLLRLRHRATQELANSVGTLPPPPSASSAPPSSVLSSGAPRRSVSDPTSRPVTPSHSRRPTPSSLLQHVSASSLSASSSRRRSQSLNSEEEDWDAELESTPYHSSPVEPASSSLRRSRTVSVGTPTTVSSSGGGVAGGKEMMILTTENMPQLLDKVKEVQEKCETCIRLLKGQTF